MRNVNTAIAEHQSPRVGPRAAGPLLGVLSAGIYTRCYMAETKEDSLAKKSPYLVLFIIKTYP